LSFPEAPGQPRRIARSTILDEPTREWRVINSEDAEHPGCIVPCSSYLDDAAPANAAAEKTSSESAVQSGP